MLQSHGLHWPRDFIQFQNLVVVGGYQSIKWIAHEAEAEVRATAHTSGVIVHHGGLSMGAFAPERVRGGA